MARVRYEYPVKDVCGKVGKESVAGFAHRGSTKYTVMYGKRSTAVSADEKTQRQKFATVCKSVRERMLDPDQSLADMVAFSQQSKYKTLRQYVFNQEWGNV